MNTFSRTFWPPGGLRPSPLAALRRLSASLRAGFFLAMLGLLWAGAPAALAHESPIGCTGSALGINLFTSTRDVHIGDTITYSVTIFNGLPGSPRVACDATEIQASLVTPDGVSHDLTSLLVRRTLMNQQNDFYPDIVSYVVRAQDGMNVNLRLVALGAAAPWFYDVPWGACPRNDPVQRGSDAAVNDVPEELRCANYEREPHPDENAADGWRVESDGLGGGICSARSAGNGSSGPDGRKARRGGPSSMGESPVLTGRAASLPAPGIHY